MRGGFRWLRWKMELRCCGGFGLKVERVSNVRWILGGECSYYYFRLMYW
jgi:hypothetical protein